MPSFSASLEEAQRIVQTNETLKRSTADASDLLQRVFRGASAQTLKKCAEIRKVAQQVEDQMAELSSNYRLDGVVQVDPTLFLQDCKQTTPLSSLVKEDSKGSIDELSKLSQHLGLLKKRSSKEKDNATLSNFLQQAATSAEKASTLLAETALESAEWSTIPASMLMLLSEVLEQEPPSSIVEEHVETLKRMQFSADELSEEQAQAVVDGDMKLSEQLYFKKITVQEAMVDVFNKAYASLDAHSTECFVQPLKRVHEVHNKVTSEMSTLLQKHDTIRGKVEEDLTNLKSRRSRATEEHTAIRANYAAFQKQAEKDVKDNTAAIESTVTSIAELERKLEQLAADRQDIMARRIRAVEQESRRQAEWKAFETFYTQQSTLLESTLHQAEVAEEVSDIFDEMLCNGCNALEQALREVDQQVEAQRVSLHETRLSQFRDLYLTLGDLQYKKERNLEELDKKIAHIHVQQELAMETFNPKAKEFSEMKKNLSTVREEMTSQLDVLEQKGQLHIEAFKPTEVALIECGKEFLHPVEELQKRNEVRQQKLIEYRTLMTQESDEALATQDDVETELRQIEEERTKYVRKKPSTPGVGQSTRSLDRDE